MFSLIQIQMAIPIGRNMQRCKYVSVSVCVCVLVSQLCPALCDPHGLYLTGSSVLGILQARILEWVAIPFSRGSSNPGIKPSILHYRRILDHLNHLGSLGQYSHVYFLSRLLASQVALVVKNLPASAGDMRAMGSIPGSGRSPGGGHGNMLQYSCLENPTDRKAWQASVHRVAHD